MASIECPPGEEFDDTDPRDDLGDGPADHSRLGMGFAYEALDYLLIGVLLVEVSRGLVTMNRTAREIAERRDGLVIRAGTVYASRPRDTVKLASLVRSAAAIDADDASVRGGAISLSRPSMLRPLSVLVAPLPRDRRTANDERPGAIVFVTDPESETTTPSGLLSLLYGLTPAEATLAAAVVQGQGLDWAAAELGITMNTARTHLKQVFGKTGVRRQAELVRLILSGPAGLRFP